MELDPEAVELAHRIFDLARDGETSTLAGYLRSGISADLTDPGGNTLLMLAAYHGRPETVQLLIEAGADLDRVNERGQTPLAGTPSALATAEYFQRGEALALLTW